MEYYKQNERTSKYAGAMAAIIYFAVWLVLMLMVNFKYEVQESGEGILVDFGDSPTAGGSGNGGMQIVAALQQSFEISPGEMMTQDYEDAPAVASPAARPSTRLAEKPKPTQTSTQPAPEPQRQVDQRAMFPGAISSGEQGTESGSGTGTGQGNGNGPGRQGSPFGTPGGDPEGTGTGTAGRGFNLAGRSLTSALPPPRYDSNKSGRVIVDITVDSKGYVIRAVPRVQGSTTNDSELIRAALDAASKARFNTVSEDALQTGTITYNFILK